MGLYYPEQQIGTLIGSKSAAGTRTAVALLSSYDATQTNEIETGGFSQIVLDINYTMGAAETTNSIEVRVKVSQDGVNFYQLMNEAVSGGTSTLTVREFTYVGVNAAASAISLPLDVMYKNMRFEFKESGVAANVGNLYCEYTLSGK